MSTLQDSFTAIALEHPELMKIVDFARHLHHGQMDLLNNEPYFQHPLRVTLNVLRLDPAADIKTLMVALLHDTIEDCTINGKKVTAQTLRDHNIPEDVIASVEILTKPDNDNRFYEDMIEDLIATDDYRAMIVKLADNMDNLHPDRIAEFMAIDHKKRLKNNEKYSKSAALLSEALGLEMKHIVQLLQDSPQITPLSYTPETPDPISRQPTHAV